MDQLGEIDGGLDRGALALAAGDHHGHAALAVEERDGVDVLLVGAQRARRDLVALLDGGQAGAQLVVALERGVGPQPPHAHRHVPALVAAEGLVVLRRVHLGVGLVAERAGLEPTVVVGARLDVVLGEELGRDQVGAVAGTGGRDRGRLGLLGDREVGLPAGDRADHAAAADEAQVAGVGVIGAPALQLDQVVALGEIAASAEIGEAAITAIRDEAALVDDEAKIREPGAGGRRDRLRHGVGPGGVGRHHGLAGAGGDGEAVAALVAPRRVDQRAGDRGLVGGVDDAAGEGAIEPPGHDVVGAGAEGGDPRARWRRTRHHQREGARRHGQSAEGHRVGLRLSKSDRPV